MNLSQAEQAITAITIGLDMTQRDLQKSLKQNSHPWTIAKVFPDAAIIGPWISYNEFPDYLEVEFSLVINDKLRQRSSGKEMMMKPAELLVYISEFFPLCRGDIIFTGTPAGVGPIYSGDIAKVYYGDKYYQVSWK